MGRRILGWLFVVIAALTVAFLLGPRVALDTTVRFDPAVIGDDPQAYLDGKEDAVPAIRPGLEKEIVWANPLIRARTPISIVYIHGFSASKGELRPLPDEVADALDANLFLARLTGHGQDGPAMTSGTVNAWINDYAEAIAIGRAIGDKVVVIATSTGASLATWAATRPELSRDVATMVLVSPNFGVRATGSQMLTWPWGKQIAEALIGKERSFAPLNPLHEKLWTTRYPTMALLPMAALVDLARNAPVETIGIPALFIFSDDDKVVRQDLTREIAARWGARHELVPVERSGDPANHVIAGDALSPATTQALADRASAWIDAVVR
ncbi:lysophospholipase [Mesorhizobium sp. L-8-10]|uniref:alpha/beta hydrolase n=1 Tax=Mesorhizobium sp. L-8-10 TaxID=2744523 RepID=UPI0019261C56|nr:alpha/beta fold hydrolase [Mesorhizobium sp. L-8-10]BCH33384.1 lysophospholipase [Mesorhizobium sp. L-8-10]